MAPCLRASKVALSAPAAEIEAQRRPPPARKSDAPLWDAVPFLPLFGLLALISALLISDHAVEVRLKSMTAPVKLSVTLQVLVAAQTSLGPLMTVWAYSYLCEAVTAQIGVGEEKPRVRRGWLQPLTNTVLFAALVSITPTVGWWAAALCSPCVAVALKLS